MSIGPLEPAKGLDFGRHVTGYGQKMKRNKTDFKYHGYRNGCKSCVWRESPVGGSIGTGISQKFRLGKARNWLWAKNEKK